ncbi:unnamed protein product [Rotaria sp. Silwood2]|nr:unnamed protein product [Rotaria sp. Silwood2]CAF3032666.1 unnamed protein product [Rotaria sp. Silwood2]CAF3219102.1 unnamed protein product [Rotaria sp. Silwood2]CAF3437080.1 unnamed protein product [Rotaria sp. Silwood2]CAF4204526.1 unnamed protein product [Rotaria sp. Silwood2]
MFAYFLLSLLILPMFNAQRLQTEFKNNDELLTERSVAANYLSGLPIRQYQDQLFDSPIDSLSLLLIPNRHNQQQQQRAKRIYWENLAFHAADYNQKPKKV